MASIRPLWRHMTRATLGKSGDDHTPSQQGTHRPAPASGPIAAGRLGRGLAAVALCMGGALISGLATTAAPAGAANPSSLLYELDFGSNTINVFPTQRPGTRRPPPPSQPTLAP